MVSVAAFGPGDPASAYSRVKQLGYPNQILMNLNLDSNNFQHRYLSNLNLTLKIGFGSKDNVKTWSLLIHLRLNFWILSKKLWISIHFQLFNQHFN